jgi:alkylation response protein AidB-like acyl-CoA dehydrogenase
MLLQPTAEQEALRQTTERYLKAQAPVAAVRALRDDPAGFDAGYWQRGCELGWTSLLVDEAHGGGSVSGAGLVDLSLIAHEFGRAAGPGPLVGCCVVAAALSTAGIAPGVVAELLAGTVIASWCLAEPPPHDRIGDVTLEIRPDGDGFVLDGVKRPVEAAAQAGYFLVTGRTGDGLTQVLVPADADGITITALHSLDLTRRFATVTFAGVRVPAEAVLGQPGKADADVERQFQQAVVISTAEAVGAMDVAYALTLAWAADRYSFGRPLNSYQALKHRLADLKSWLEAAHAITDEAAAAVATAAPEADELVSAAKAFVSDYGSELLQDCVQLHGGIGVTFEHDLHLYLRRHTVDRALFGTPDEHRRRLTDIVEQREAAR